MTTLGFLYVEGKVVARDLALAHSWFRRAALKDEPYALASLGHLYRKGIGVVADLDKARAWEQRAASKDQAQAPGITLDPPESGRTAKHRGVGRARPNPKR